MKYVRYHGLGNGLHIFSRYLYDQGLVHEDPFTIETLGGTVICDPAITVHMPGGELAIKFSKDFAATMTGPVVRICEGVMDKEMFESK